MVMVNQVLKGREVNSSLSQGVLSFSVKGTRILRAMVTLVLRAKDQGN